MLAAITLTSDQAVSPSVAGLRQFFVLPRKRFLNAFLIRHLLMPFPGFWVLLLPFLGKITISHSLQRNAIPRNEHQVRKANLVSYEIRLARLCEMGVNDRNYAAHFVLVALHGRGDFLLVKLQCCQRKILLASHNLDVPF